MRSSVLQFMVLLLAAVACRGEGSAGNCTFHGPDVLITLEDELFSSNEIVRRDSEPDALLFLIGRLSRDEKHDRAIKFDLKTGKQEPASMPYDGSGNTPNQPGYTRFQGGRHDRDVHPLIATKKLRFEYLGKKSSVSFPNRDYDGHWSLASEEHFTGTRRLVYGNRPLMEQDFVDAVTGYVPLNQIVQIEPDGDRIVVLCTDLKNGTRLGIFSKKKLEAEQKRGGTSR